MTPPPLQWSALCLLVFLLGLRHGFDGDHLACIDGLTRHNQRQATPFARYCGLLFSLGHGAVVAGIALAVVIAGRRLQAPAWLQVAGEWSSICCLAAIGAINARALMRSPSDALLHPVGIRSGFLGGLSRASSPLTVLLVGALFAISFDTMSQATFFALSAAAYGAGWHALMLAALFAAGMIATDALNGIWISRLIARADRLAVVASRIVTIAVAGTSFLIAGIGAAALLRPEVSRWCDERSLQIGLLVSALMATSYLCARWLARSDVAVDPGAGMQG